MFTAYNLMVISYNFGSICISRIIIRTSEVCSGMPEDTIRACLCDSHGYNAHARACDNKDRAVGLHTYMKRM